MDKYLRMRTDDALIFEAYIKESEECPGCNTTSVVFNDTPHSDDSKEEKKEVTIGYQILSQLDKLEHNLASKMEDDLKARQKVLKTIKDLTNSLLEMHGAQHD